MMASDGIETSTMTEVDINKKQGFEFQLQCQKSTSVKSQANKPVPKALLMSTEFIGALRTKEHWKLSWLCGSFF